MQIQIARARPAAQVLVGASNRKIDIERHNIDRQDSQRVVNIEQDSRARIVSSTGERTQFGQHLTGVEHYLRKHR